MATGFVAVHVGRGYAWERESSNPPVIAAKPGPSAGSPFAAMTALSRYLSNELEFFRRLVLFRALKGDRQGRDTELNGDRFWRRRELGIMSAVLYQPPASLTFRFWTISLRLKIRAIRELAFRAVGITPIS